MSTVLFKRGTETEMNNTPVTDGLVYFCTSNNKIYMDNENTRLQYGGGTTLISDASQASVTNVFNSNASLQLFLQKTTVVDTKAAAMSITQSHIPLGCLAFKEAIGTNDYSAIGNGTISGALTNLNQKANTASTNISSLTNQLKANNTSIYMDYHDGKYGYNTNANRGAGTFHPFKGAPTSREFYNNTPIDYGNGLVQFNFEVGAGYVLNEDMIPVITRETYWIWSGDSEGATLVNSSSFTYSYSGSTLSIVCYRHMDLTLTVYYF